MDIEQSQMKVLEAKIDALQAKIDRMYTNDLYSLMTADDIAKMVGISRRSLYNRRWLIPGFGANEASHKTYFKKEVLEWLDRGFENLKAEYLKRGL